MSDIHVGKTILESAGAGATAGAITGPWGSAAGAIIGAVVGIASALVSVAEQDKWNEIQNFISDLLMSPNIPKSSKEKEIKGAV